MTTPDAKHVRGFGLWVLLATLATLSMLATFVLGNDAWAFRPPDVHARGIFAPVVRAADGEWSVGLVRSGPMVALLLVMLAAALALRFRSWPRPAAGALVAVVTLLVIVPPLVLQVGLREATAPWFYTNDSTYQIELAGDLLLDGENPYGHDFRTSGLERFYTLDGTESDEVRSNQVVLRHFIYFPGTALTSAAWRLLPSPFDDYRFFVLLATLALGAAFWLVPAPTTWKLALGAVAAANPIAVHAVWFGTADAVSLVPVVLAFAFLARRRETAAAASLAVAVLLKQFALVALPFFVVALMMRKVPRRAFVRATAVFAVIVVAGIAPFALADPQAFWADTVEFGAGTHRIVGYGLSALLLRAGILNDRDGPYPFGLLVVLLWLPLTAWLVWSQVRARALWVAATGFAISIFVLEFLARTFHKSYLIWPLTAISLAALLAAAEHRRGALADPNDERPAAPA